MQKWSFSTKVTFNEELHHRNNISAQQCDHYYHIVRRYQFHNHQLSDQPTPIYHHSSNSNTMQVPAMSTTSGTRRPTSADHNSQLPHPPQQHFWDRQVIVASDSRPSNPTSSTDQNLSHSTSKPNSAVHNNTSMPYLPAGAVRQKSSVPNTNTHSTATPSPYVNQAQLERPAPEPTSLFSSKPPTGEPIVLLRDEAEKDRFEDMSAVFSLITTTERLENIWARRGAFSKDDYEHHCETLIHSYNALRPSIDKYIPNIDMFIAEYDCKASKARGRLQAGVPATVQVAGAGTAKAKDRERAVMRCTFLFHEITNTIDLKQLSKYFLLPSLTSLMKMLNVLSTQNDNLEINHKLRKWVEKLNDMQPYEQLTDEEGSALRLDMDLGFDEFETLCTS